MYGYVLCCWIICWFVVILGHSWGELTRALFTSCVSIRLVLWNRVLLEKQVWAEIDKKVLCFSTCYHLVMNLDI